MLMMDCLFTYFSTAGVKRANRTFFRSYDFPVVENTNCVRTWRVNAGVTIPGSKPRY